MFEHIVDRDFVKTEMQFRAGRTQADIVGRRRRRLLGRRSSSGAGETGWTVVR
ncbi:hypothetical protein [Nocardioides sp.]|uniref:hypothetical protein n=1 Tax=Nocardioides sp. TaxID=35761 RepID=UPI0037845AE0